MPDPVALAVTNLADIPARLRDLADRIEAGDEGKVDAVVAIIAAGPAVEVFGFGAADTRVTMGLLGLAARKVETDD